MTAKNKKQKPISNTVVVSFRIDKDILYSTDIKNEIKKIIFNTKISYNKNK